MWSHRDTEFVHQSTYSLGPIMVCGLVADSQVAHWKPYAQGPVTCPYCLARKSTKGLTGPEQLATVPA